MFSLQDRFQISDRYNDCVMPLERHRVMDMKTDGSCMEAEGAYNKSAGGCTIVGRQEYQWSVIIQQNGERRNGGWRVNTTYSTCGLPLAICDYVLLHLTQLH